MVQTSTYQRKIFISYLMKLLKRHCSDERYHKLRDICTKKHLFITLNIQEKGARKLLGFMAVFIPRGVLQAMWDKLNSYVSQIPKCTAVSRSDEQNPEHFQPTLPGHLTDGHGQWAEWWLARACQPCQCSASYQMIERWSGLVLITHSRAFTNHAPMAIRHYHA